MRYFSENDDHIGAECEQCGKVSKIKREKVISTPQGDSLNPPGGILCSCGAVHHTMKKKTSYTGTNYYVNQKSCPYCKSGNYQTIKMMCLSQTSSGSSTGIGVSTDLDIGVGTINTNTQSVLAKKYIPGQDPVNESRRTGCGCIFGSVFLFIFGDLHGFFTFLGVLSLIVGVIALATKEGNPEQQKWKAKVKLYEQGWICHKCGKTWLS